MLNNSVSSLTVLTRKAFLEGSKTGGERKVWRVTWAQEAGRQVQPPDLQSVGCGLKSRKKPGPGPRAGEVGLGRKEAGILAKERPRLPLLTALLCWFSAPHSQACQSFRIRTGLGTQTQAFWGGGRRAFRPLWGPWQSQGLTNTHHMFGSRIHERVHAVTLGTQLVGG